MLRIACIQTFSLLSNPYLTILSNIYIVPTSDLQSSTVLEWSKNFKQITEYLSPVELSFNSFSITLSMKSFITLKWD